jgi:hypothetical protein
VVVVPEAVMMFALVAAQAVAVGVAEPAATVTVPEAAMAVVLPLVV